jgi:hypothetical protein
MIWISQIGKVHLQVLNISNLHLHNFERALYYFAGKPPQEIQIVESYYEFIAGVVVTDNFTLK